MLSKIIKIKNCNLLLFYMGVKRCLDLGKDGKTLLNWTYEKWDKTVDWINFAQDRNMWRAFVETVKKPLASIKCGEYLQKLRNYRLRKKGSAPMN
jgi:hypothetical protein